MLVSEGRPEPSGAGPDRCARGPVVVIASATRPRIESPHVSLPSRGGDQLRLGTTGTRGARELSPRSVASRYRALHRLSKELGRICVFFQEVTPPSAARVTARNDPPPSKGSRPKHGLQLSSWARRLSSSKCAWIPKKSPVTLPRSVRSLGLIPAAS